MKPISIALIIGFIHFICFVSSEELQAFTLHVASSAVSTASVSAAQQTVTVWFHQYVYRCAFTPSSLDTDYSCDAATYFIGCDASSDPIGAKMLIENNHGDAPMYSSMTITTDLGTYTVSGVCIDDAEAIGAFPKSNFGGDDTLCDAGYSQYTAVCNDVDNCSPPKQLIYFDTTSINTDIENAEWQNGASLTYTVDASSATCGICSDTCAALTALKGEVAAILAGIATIEDQLGADTSGLGAEFTTKYNGELMVFLVAMNVMLLIVLGICYCRSDVSKRYAPVQMYATTDDEKPL